MPNRVTVRVPATSANLGAGFDCLGLALDLWSAVTVWQGRERAADPMARMALGAARRLYEALNRGEHVRPAFPLH